MAAKFINVQSLTSEDKDFYDLLLSAKLDTYFSLLKENGITGDNLKYLTEKDITDLFGKSIGVRAEFRAFLNDYRKVINLPSLNACCCKYTPNTNQIDVRQSIGTNILAQQNVSYKGNYVFNMDAFLRSTVGKELLESYNKKNDFTVEERGCLVTSIVKCHLENNTPMPLALLDKIANEICVAFKGEVKKYYFEKEPYIHGKLYTKFKTLFRSYKNSGILTNVIKYKTKTLKQQNDIGEPSTSIDQNIVAEEIKIEPFENDIEWLYKYKTPWTTVEHKWKKTFYVRDLQIQQKSNSLSQILEIWPLLCQPNGASLIEIDFDIKFPGKSNNLFDIFESLEPNLIGIFKKNMTYKPGKRMLKSLSSHREYRKVQYVKLLNVIVRPTARKFVNDALWKVSISECWDSFLIFVENISEIEAALNKRKEFCAQKQITLQPGIIVIGNVNAFDFIVFAETISYRFKKFLRALDILFKLYYVLNISYPFESSNFFNFLQDCFYNIESTVDFSNYKSLFDL